MIIILSPAKTLKMEKAINTNLYTEPIFIREASSLIRELVKYSPPEMEGLMKVNSKLAEQNFMRHIRWSEEHDLSNSKQALLAYDGAVYKGISAGDLNEKQLTFANDHLIILSGLYGALKPLDLIKPYRLEMGTKLKNRRGINLYDFWERKLTAYLKSELKKQQDNILIDLASKEYSSVIDMSKINVRLITPVFKDYKNGNHKTITMYTKRARVDFTNENIKGITPLKMEATYLMWLDCRGLNLDNKSIEDLFFKKAKIALDSGHWFGKTGDGFMRINIACPRAMLEDGLNMLKAAVEDIGN